MKRSFISYGLLALWALSIIGGLLIYSEKQLKPFDPNLTLTDAAMNPEFDQSVATQLIAAGVSPGSVVRLTHSDYCYCNTLVDSHQSELISAIDDDTYVNTTLSLDDYPQLSAVIPAYPALAVLDEHSQLRYLGPYAKGYGCFNGKTLLSQIAVLAQSQDYFGAVINADVNGCFCHQNQA